MLEGLNLKRLVDVDVVLTPQTVPRRGFGVLLIVGDSDVINGQERIRTYLELESVELEFGTSAPEYQAALLYFSQAPKPRELMIGRWLRTPTQALLNGGLLTPAEQDIANWTSILDGTFTIFVDAIQEDLTALDFSFETNLNGVANVIDTAFVAGTVTWDGVKFVARSNSTGATATISFATPEGTGTDISAMLKLDSATALQAPINGFDSETPLEAITALSNITAEWYASSFAATVMPVNSDYVAIAGYTQAQTIPRVFLITEQDPSAKDINYLLDIEALIRALNYTRTWTQFSETGPFDVVSLFGRIATTDFTKQNSIITLMYKDEPLVTPAILTENQANVLEIKRYNVFAKYQNNRSIIQYATASGDEITYCDEVQGLDWFANALQTALFNLLYDTPTKIPGTSIGQNQIYTEVAKVCEDALFNALIAPGIWDGADLFNGALQNGQQLERGYLIFMPDIRTQPAATRALRIAPPVDVALKMANAIHKVDILVSVNR